MFAATAAIAVRWQFRYAKQRIFGLLRQSPRTHQGRPARTRLMHTPLGKLPVMRKAASYIEQARTPPRPYGQIQSDLPPPASTTIFPSTFLASIDQRAPLSFSNASGGSQCSRARQQDARLRLAFHPLRQRSSQSHWRHAAGVDAFPIARRRSARLLLKLPRPNTNSRGAVTLVFKEALKVTSCRWNHYQEKTRFGLPSGTGFLKHQGLLQLARESLAVLTDKGIPQGLRRRAFKNHLPAFPGYYGEMVWISMMLGQWLLSWAFIHHNRNQIWRNGRAIALTDARHRQSVVPVRRPTYVPCS